VRNDVVLRSVDGKYQLKTQAQVCRMLHKKFGGSPDVPHKWEQLGDFVEYNDKLYLLSKDLKELVCVAH